MVVGLLLLGDRLLWLLCAVLLELELDLSLALGALRLPNVLQELLLI